LEESLLKGQPLRLAHLKPGPASGSLVLGTLLAGLSSRGDLFGLVASPAGVAQLSLEASDSGLGGGELAHRLPRPIRLADTLRELAVEVSAKRLLGVGALLGGAARPFAVADRGTKLVRPCASFLELTLEIRDPGIRLGPGRRLARRSSGLRRRGLGLLRGLGRRGFVPWVGLGRRGFVPWASLGRGRSLGGSLVFGLDRTGIPGRGDGGREWDDHGAEL
ncbi:MAG: hypothetical protein WAK93_07065, partial [Solirubrobacteraceae bacterium]